MTRPEPRDLPAPFVEALEDVDEIDITNIRAFTWTPDPSKYPSYQPRDQYKCLMTHILLMADKYFSMFCFIPEINTNGNVHIHGWYLIKDQIKYYKQFLPRCRQYGFVLVKDKINKKWFDYLSKELHITEEVIGEDLPIALTHNNIEYYSHMRIKLKLIKRKAMNYTIPVHHYFRKRYYKKK